MSSVPLLGDFSVKLDLTGFELGLIGYAVADLLMCPDALAVDEFVRLSDLHEKLKLLSVHFIGGRA